ncbi:MAG: filamentous hemagglutinin family protein [Pseudomonadota bacterium]
MPPRPALQPSASFRATLLASASALALILGCAPAQAMPLYATRGGGGASATANAAAAALAGSQQAQAIGQQMTHDLLRAALAIQSVRQAQVAARALAQQQPSGVANGLAPGGLVVDPRVTAGTDANLWVNAHAPVQTVSNGQTLVTVQQTAQRAITTWQSFNVGRSTTVDFDQSQGNTSNGNNWVMLSRIDATGVPSQIEGQIKADGTVLIINPNGIVFSGTSQINVHTLIASTLDIDSFKGSNVANVGAFSVTSGGTYIPVQINGVTQTTPSGTAILAPPDEDNANQAFLSSGLYVNGVINNAGTLVMAQGFTGGQTNAGVVVAPGAQISTNISGFDNGGYVALLGTSVDNAGSISTPSGQIILAASPDVFLAEPATGSANTSIGVSSLATQTQALVFNGIAGESPATNEAGGLLAADDGNITMFGDVVNQLGVAAATTSVTRAGSITFTANQQLNLGGASVTGILPDESDETIPQSSVSSFVGPTINIAAADVDLQGDAGGEPGALIVAPSAAMTVATGLLTSLSGTNRPLGRFLQESGSVIDLAGLDAAASIRNYIFTFKVTSNDVADSPLAQSLIGQTVTIDLTQGGTRSDGLTWVGSPLFSATGAGYLGAVPQTIDQLLTKGGSLSFTSSPFGVGEQPFNDVIQAPGSVIDVSGGFTQFTGAKVATTELLAATGEIFNIADADPLVPYEGIAGQFVIDHNIDGRPDSELTQYFSSPLIARGFFDPGFIAGASAGALSISTANPVLEGALLGATVTGSRQAELAESDTGPNGSQASIDQLPRDASLTISLVSAFGAPAPDAVVLQSGVTDVLGPDFGIESTLNLPSTDLIVGESATGPVTAAVPVVTYSTDALSAAQLGSITISASSDLSMSQGAVLTVQPGGSIKFTGVSTIDGTLTAHGGSISLTGFTGGTSVSEAPPVSQVTIGPDAVLDVSGLFVNDAGAGFNTLQGDAHINGGSVTIQTDLESNSTGVGFNGGANVPPVVDVTQSIVLAQGSIVDVSSGGYVQPSGQLKFGPNGLPAGNGGNLSLITYNNAVWSNPQDNFQEGGPPGNIAPNGTNRPDVADVFMDGTIFSGGLNGGGTFALQVPIIQIGGVDTVTSGAAPGTVALPGTFFSDNGFSAYSLTSTYGSTTVLAGTNVPLRQQNYLIELPAALPASGARVRDFAALGLAPFGMRQPVSLTLAETPFPYGGTNDVSTNAGVTVEAGATIEGEPGASIDLTAAGPVTVLGNLIAPGGSITLDNDGTPVNLQQLAQGQSVGVVTQAPLDVWIGANAVLDVDGTFVPNLTARPLLSTGNVLNGGSITLEGGTVIALPGSQFDLAGASAIVQNFGPIVGFGWSIIEQPIWSNGGTLTITGSMASALGTSGEFQAAYFDGTVDAAGGAPQASGGTLTIGGLNGSNPLYGAIVISQGGDVTAALSSQTVPTTAAQLAAQLPTASSTVEIGENTLNNSGLDSVSLMAGTIGFSGNVSVKVPDQLVLAGNLRLLPAGNMNSNFSAASIGATQVSLTAGDLLLTSNAFVAPTLSDGTLNLYASAQIDLAGYASISNAAKVNLTSGGDIRLLSDTDAEFASGIFTSGSGNNVSTYFSTLIQFLSTLTSESIVQSPGALVVPNDLTLTAREIFPTSESIFLLQSTGAGTGNGTINTITIASNGQAPVTPLSVAGEIVVDAANIVQNGALEAPLGTIQLGLSAGQTFPSAFSTNAFTLPAAVTTQSLVLDGGSLTSVSAAGIDIPFGTTINNTNFAVVGSNIVASESDVANPVLTAPPTKAIELNGASIDSQAGAVLNLSGGGDFFGTEFVPGTGGSHNVLTEIGGQPVYALVPSFEAPVAPNDPTQGALIAPGTSVTLQGGNGIAAGTYVLLPAIYATMPGALRVVVTATNTTQTNTDFLEPDGSILMAGTLGNVVTGARSSSTALLEIQSQAAWSKYSEIDKASANSYFANLAATKGTETPLLPIDAGQLVIGATSALTLLGTNDFAPAPGGRGGIADITGTNILVLAPDQTAPAADAGFIILDADQISDLGAESVLIGGVRSQESDGSTLITPTASAIVIDTDAAHPLSAPDLLVAANPTANNASNSFVNVSNDVYTYAAQIPVAATGTGRISVLPGSVVEAKGLVPSTQRATMHLGQTVAPFPSPTLKQLQKYYTSQTNAAGAYVLSNANPVTQFYDQVFSGGGLAALLEVSNGQPSNIQRSLPSLPASVTVIGGGPHQASNYTFTPAPLPSAGSIDVDAAAVLAGGNALTVSGGNVTLANTAALSGRNITLGASVINLGNAPATAVGLTLTPSVIAQFAGTQSVTLISNSVFNLYDTNGVNLGAANNPIGTLVLDSAGLFSAGGTTTITADNVALTDSQATPNTAGAIAGSGGTLIVDANVNSTGTLTLSAGQVEMNGEGQVDLNAAGQIVFAGTGGVNAGAAAVTLQAPDVVAAVGSVQSLTTTGLLNLMPGESAAPSLSPFDIGGSLSLTGGSIDDAGAVTALGGKVTLTATSGDVVLAQGANISATDSHIAFFNVSEDAPGGTVKLIANSGNVIIDNGATVDVAATGIGFAGSLTIQTPGTATLDGTLLGGGAFGDLGGNFTLTSGNLVGSLPFNGGFSGSFNVTLQQGDITIAAGTTLTSGNVALTANSGSVIVDGTINASGPTGGFIQLFGAGTGTIQAGTAGATGVIIGSTAQLIATYQADNPNDPNFGNGESTLVQTGGTIELGTSGTATPNAYNATYGYEDVAGSGAISVAQGALFDVSGGPGGASINNAGGMIILRAPILTDNNVNVSFQGIVNTSDHGGPSGGGVALDAYAVWSTTDQTSESAGQHFDGIIDPAGWFSDAGTKVAGTTIDGDIFTPNAANQDHVKFYTKTLLGFVNNPFDSTAIANDFTGASGVALGSTLHLRPEIDLINPTPASGSKSVNGGNITVASNWNLGAGSFNASGNFVPVFRTTVGADAGEPGVLTLAAANNVQINATISDGFYEPSDPFSKAQLPATAETLATALSSFNQDMNFDATISGTFGGVAGEPGMPAGVMAPPPSAGAFPAGWNVADEEVYYAEIYNSYASVFATLGTLNFSGPATNPAADFKTVGASGTVFDNNPADYTSYAAYVTAFNKYYVGSLPALATIASFVGATTAQTITSFDNDPTTFGSYQTYLAAYNTYAFDYATFATDFYKANPTGLVPTVQAPIPPSTFNTGTETTATGYFTDYQAYTKTYQSYIEPYFMARPNQDQVEPGNVSDDSSGAHAPDSLYLIAMPFLPAPGDTPNLAINVTPTPAGPGNAIANNPAINGTLADLNTTSAANLMTAAISGQGSFSYNFIAGTQFTTSQGLAVDPDTLITVPAGTVTTGASAGLSDSVTINGHTSYTNANKDFGKTLTIDVPTLVRTGTGSIDIAAAGSVEMLDTTAPGAIYSAGVAADPAPGFDAPTSPIITSLSYQPTGLLSNPAWGVNGGAVTITAGSDIVGIETPADNSTGSQSGFANMPTGEFWSAWYYVSGDAAGGAAAPFNPSQGGIQNSTWINYGTFFQGVGALGGGNVSLKAGADIDDISASLPETIQVSGGQSIGDPPVAHFFGGGDLTVQAGGNLNSSTFYVGRGTGSINVGGVVQADPDNPVTGTPTQLIPITYNGSGIPTLGTGIALPLLLAVQDGFITVNADQDVTLGAVFDPTRIIFDTSKLGNELSVIGASSLPAGVGATFDSFGPDSGVAMNSTAGDVTLDTLLEPTNTNVSGVTDSLFIKVGHNASRNATGAGSDAPPSSGDGGGEPDHLGPATLEAAALAGDITLDNNLLLFPSTHGTLDLLAGGSISTVTPIPGLAGSAGEFVSSFTMLDATAISSTTLLNILGTPTPAALSQALHVDDSVPAIIYARDDITGDFNLIKPAEMEAGVDIVNTTFIGQNNNSTDITSVIAGRDILAKELLVNGGIADDSSTFAVYGPGTFLIDAGRNLGPFFSGSPVNDISAIPGQISGIYAVGDGSNFGSTKSYLPVEGATVYALFGTGSGADDQAAIDDFVNPANAGSDQGIDFRPSIAQQLDQQLGQQFSQLVTEAVGTVDQTELDLLNQSLSKGGLAPVNASDLQLLVNLADSEKNNGALTEVQLGQLATLNRDLSKSGIQGFTQAMLASTTLSPDFSLTSSQAVALFQSQAGPQQSFLIDRAFLDLLTNVTKDFNNPASPTFKNANQAYAAIEILFPASNGFTNDNVSAGTNPVMVHTGDLSMAHSLLETQTGGDINIVGPGGNIIVGANATDSSSPSQEGILTLQGGSIRTYTDGSVIVDQSRIFTEQGGDVDMFSANGDLNAGKGPKSSASFPPLELICDSDGFCRVNPTGLVTGAGIGALLSVPGQDPANSNANLAAPHGIIDAGAAGIRVAGNLNLVALQVLNAFNIDVQGVTIGVPTAASPNIGALTSATNAAGAAQAAVPAPAQHANVQPSILIVEIEGYGGDEGQDQNNSAPEKPQRRQSGELDQDQNSAYQILGAGDLTNEETEALIRERRKGNK